MNAAPATLTRQQVTALIAESLRALVAPAQIFEVRILNYTKPSGYVVATCSGYFDDVDLAAQAIAPYDGHAAGIYFTPNKIAPALFARAANRIREVRRGESTTGDSNVTRRRWLLIDADPVRVSGISATHAEHLAALERVEDVRAWLSARGWPEPIRANSGNGAHALYAVDEPNTPEARALFEKCLLALDQQFSDGAVTIDKSVFTAARIWKVYGTLACKGDATPDRPHRHAQLIYVPAPLETVSTEQLEALAAGYAPQPAAAQQQQGKPAHTQAKTAAPFDVEAWLNKHQISHAARTPWNGGGWIWQLVACPFSDAHTDSAFVAQLPNGAISAGCHHASCNGKGWRELRAMFDGTPQAHTGAEPPAWLDDSAPEAFAEAIDEMLNEQPVRKLIWSAADLLNTEFPDPVWVVPDMLPAGLASLAGRPKLGKSWLALQIAVAVGSGGMVFGKQIEQRRVLYLALEDGTRRIQKRLRQQGATDTTNIDFIFDWLPLARGGAEVLLEKADSQEYGLIVIDTFSRAAGRVDQMDLAVTGELLGRIQQSAMQSDILILMVDHHRKSAGNGSGDPIDDVMGSTGKSAPLDVSMGLYRERGKKDATLKITGRDIEEQELGIAFDPVTGSWQVVGTAQGVRKNSVQGEIVAALQEFGGTATAAKLARFLGKEPRNITTELQELVAKGAVTRGTKKGVEVPYSLADEPFSGAQST